MVVVTSVEFSKNVNKYMEMATTQKVVIQHNETKMLELQMQDNLPDDFNEAISFDELMEGINQGLEEIFSNKNRRNESSI